MTTTPRKSTPRKAAPRKRVPASAPRPTDHLPPKSARQAEAEDGFVIVEQCGMALNIPIGGKVPLEAFIAFKAGDEIGGTELLLGEEQWAEFLKRKPTLDDFNDIGRALNEAAGN